MPNDHGIFCLVLDHLLRNAHRYFHLDGPSDFQQHILQSRFGCSADGDKVEQLKELNKKLRVACNLKSKKRITEQQEVVRELKEEFKSFRNMSFQSGVSLKTVHSWCSLPKDRVNKSSELASLRKQEFEKFLLQDTISFAHPSKKYAGKRFLIETLEMTRKRYLEQSEYHKYGIISMSSMKSYQPSYIMLSSKTPLDQCLCDKCENFEQILKALLAIGMKCVPSNRYAAVDRVVCSNRCVQSGSEHSFPKLQCISGECQNCGEHELYDVIKCNNEQIFSDNKRISWRKWVNKDGKSAHQKLQIKGTVNQALTEMISLLGFLKGHLFRANWNRNLFEYMRKHLSVGYVVQIFEMHDCSKENSYMGLWQIVQAASVLNCPIYSVFPTSGDEIMRLDFHRMFFPLENRKDKSSEPIIIMWTGVQRSSAPNHFVPLLPKRNK